MRVGNGPMTHAIQAERPFSKRRVTRRIARTAWKDGRPVGIFRYAPGQAPMTERERAAVRRDQLEAGVRRAFVFVAVGALLTVLRALWGAKPVAS